ncbi:hypothetical protein Ahy_B09g097706 isoform B [Arachis hypogaea]|uniref:Protein FAR1-RELATED SEQUENCE n=1 Tax=Arachis hypogaea TaxID=3818 RepID=A0A444XPP5_ARAHY|nr:hypothetical protein Ahy_B09g097706 isoform B [Arachis hypogaea]
MIFCEWSSKILRKLLIYMKSTVGQRVLPYDKRMFSGQEMTRKSGSQKRAQGCDPLWFVARFVDDHNHDLLPQKFVENLLSYRRISDVDIAHMDSLRQVGIFIPKIYESIAAQVGAFNCISFTK